VRRSRGATLVLVTHDPAVAAVADAQLVLRDGRVAETPAAARNLVS
jgi:predicted ABC-type transport system involved in lysophospholipase L1 biosynthesis ATPase subunit